MAYPKRGEIYLVHLPGHAQDLKPRPAVIVSMDVRNRLANDVIVVPITTTLRSSPTHVGLASGEGGLDKASMVKGEQVTTIDKSFLLRGPFSGVISQTKMVEVEKAIQDSLGIIA